MRKFLLFLLLFAAGLGTLLFVQRAMEPAESTLAPVEEPPEPEPEELLVVEGESGDTGVVSGGALRHSERNEYMIEASDHGPQGEGIYWLHDLEVTFYDEETGAVTGAVEALSAVVHMQADETGVHFNEDYDNELEDVVLRFLDGPPPSPVTMRLPAATAALQRREFSSEGAVDIVGVGLVATGVGLEAESLAGSFRIETEPEVRLRLEDGSDAVLSSAGPLQMIRRSDLGEGEVELSVTEAARFEWGGAEPLLLTADEIRVLGRLTEEDGGQFQPRSVTADGQVVLIPAEGRFTADHGQLAFDADGQPAEALLEGQPAIALELRGREDEEHEPLPLEATGLGPLVLALGQAQAFDFTGPATILLPTLPLTVRAQGGLSGTRTLDEGFASLSTRGGATVEHEEFNLSTDSFDLEAFEDGTGETGLRLNTESAARTHGLLEDGRSFELTAREGFVVLRSQDSLRIPEGRGIELTVEGPNGFAARADSVRDFNPDTLQFLAEGQVVLENEQGQGAGERLESFGVDRAELSGSEDKPAHLEFEGGALDAGWVEYTERAVRAREAVVAAFRLEQDEYELQADWVQLDRRPLTPDAEGPEFTVDAGGGVRVIAKGQQRRLELNSDFFRLQAESDGASTELGDLQPAFVLASGNTHFTHTGEFEIEGWGDRLEMQRDRTGRLYPIEGQRTRVAGTLPTEDIAFEMTAGIVDFSADRLIAVDADLISTSVPELLADAPPVISSVLPSDTMRLVAGRMACDRQSILLTESAYLGQQVVGRPDWSVDAQNILITADSAVEGDDGPRGKEALQDLTAWGGFTARAGASMSAQGDYLEIDRETGLLNIVGDPVILGREGLSWESSWFELNLRTAFMQSGPGSMTSGETEEGGGWSLSYTSLEPVENPDETIQIMREPRMLLGERELRASWALLWMDTREWSKLSAEALDGTPAGDAVIPAQRNRRPPHPDSLFGQLDTAEFGNWLREIYLEGNIELLDKGVRMARADAIYLDRVDGHAWVKKFDLAIDLPFGRDDTRLKLRADWLRHSADGSFRAEGAVATTCHFEEPHYVVRLGDLKVDPRYRERPRKKNEPGPGDTVEEPDGWDVTSKNNSVTLGKYFVLPMPKMKVPVETDSSGGLKVDADRFSLGGLQPINFGSDSKMGSFISTTFTTDLGFVSKGVHRLLGGRSDGSDLSGKTSVRPAYNNDRGVAVGVETEMDGGDRYKLLYSIDLIEDTGEDRGLVRVDEDDRDRIRAWYRVRGRRMLGDKEWIDLVVTHQTDPGVQAEFFESEYLRFEERESYLHWRLARDPDYFSVTAEKNLDDFRTEVQEQPTLNHVRGRAEVGSWRGVSLVYTSKTELGRFVREEGNVPTEAPFADGFGEQEALRFDTAQRLEAPFSLGVMGLRAIPYLEGRATAWDIDSATGTGPTPSAEDPARMALMGGAVLATTFWRGFAGGARHSLAPFVGVRADLAVEGDDEPLVRFDEVEDSIEGRFVDVGVRSHWVNPKLQSFFDLELIETHAADRAGTAPDAWLPLRVHGSWFIPVAGMPFGISHDARYDLESGDTPYSRTQIGLEPIEQLTLETGYHSARDLTGQTLYNVLSVGATLKVSPKWEIEGGHGFSTQGNGRLSSDLQIRRIGHDFVFEVSYRFQAGEGRSSLDYSISPLLGWKPSNPSFLRRLHEAGD